MSPHGAADGGPGAPGEQLLALAVTALAARLSHDGQAVQDGSQPVKGCVDDAPPSTGRHPTVALDLEVGVKVGVDDPLEVGVEVQRAVALGDGVVLGCGVDAVRLGRRAHGDTRWTTQPPSPTRT